jgi:hypothetical protein
VASWLECPTSTQGADVPQRRFIDAPDDRVLRLAAQGLSYRQIGRSLNVSASTVQGKVKRAQRVGLSWPLPPRSAVLQVDRYPIATSLP